MSDLADVSMTREADAVVVRISGEMDMSNADEIRRAIETGVSNSDRGLILDLEETTYVDSSALRVFFTLAGITRARDQSFALAVPKSALIRKVLELTELERVVPVYPTTDEALDHVQRADGAPNPQ